MSRPGVRLQWFQLIVLSGAHFVADMFGNMLPVILPALRKEFSMTLTIGGLVASACVLTSNLVQLVMGHTRANKTVPLLLYIGLILGCAICFISLLPRTTTGVWVMVALAAVSGTGIALVHPEGLRAVHRLNKLPHGICTAVFMTGGFLGFSCGGAISTEVVDRFGLDGLKWIALCPVVGLLIVVLARVKLAVENESNPIEDAAAANVKRVPFWPLMLVAIPAGISTTVFALLLPTRLAELGFELTWGGYSSTVYGLGAAAGAFTLGYLANRRDELKLAVITLFASVPVLAIYLLLIEHRAAIALLFGCGFAALGHFILIITLARHASGPNLGRRMGFIVGGTWGSAVLVFMILTIVYVTQAHETEDH